MTAKEKAEELVEKMWFVNPLFYFVTGNRNYGHAKQCAIIAVDEIIEMLKSSLDFEMKKSITFWKEAKQEIEKL